VNESIKQFLIRRGLNSISDVKWAHAVNSVHLLDQALSSPNIDFLEVDISLSKDGVPIAAHYHDKSDLSFDNLIRRIKESEKRLKLDFKDQNAVVLCLEMLANSPLKQPVMLNADILSVEDAPEAIASPELFINTCMVNYPKGLLSLGWRTTENSAYSPEDIDKMLDICKGLESATFPVRASILPKFWRNVRKLIENKNHTLTIWNSQPPEDDLKNWIFKNTDPQKCFYDVLL
jgi:hypothetical protein